MLILRHKGKTFFGKIQYVKEHYFYQSFFRCAKHFFIVSLVGNI